VVLTILSVGMMALDHRQHQLESVRSALSVIVYPLQYLVDLPVSASSWVGENLSSRETLLKENSKYKIQNTLFKAQLQKLQSLKAENLRLRELLQASRKVNERILIGELLSVSLEPFTRQILINKGSNDEVYLGQPLVDAEGAMGQIIHVGPFASSAMLITDPNHAIPVQVNRNGLRAIALGTGATEKLDIPYLPISADIVEGDLLITSGLGGRFPTGYPVATVTQVIKDPTLPYAVITAMPSAQLEKAREVLLVWPTQHGEMSAKASAPSPEPATSATQADNP
jgi:rod shape-determining protein MreC